MDTNRFGWHVHDLKRNLNINLRHSYAYESGILLCPVHAILAYDRARKHGTNQFWAKMAYETIPIQITAIIIVVVIVFAVGV